MTPGLDTWYDASQNFLKGITVKITLPKKCLPAPAGNDQNPKLNNIFCDVTCHHKNKEYSFAWLCINMQELGQKSTKTLHILHAHIWTKQNMILAFNNYQGTGRALVMSIRHVSTAAVLCKRIPKIWLYCQP